VAVVDAAPAQDGAAADGVVNRQLLPRREHDTTKAPISDLCDCARELRQDRGGFGKTAGTISGNFRCECCRRANNLAGAED